MWAPYNYNYDKLTSTTKTSTMAISKVQNSHTDMSKCIGSAVPAVHGAPEKVIT